MGLRFLLFLKHIHKHKYLLFFPLLNFVVILRYLFDQHPEDRGRQSGLPQTTWQGADQLQQKEESG